MVVKIFLLMAGFIYASAEKNSSVNKAADAIIKSLNQYILENGFEEISIGHLLFNYDEIREIVKCGKGKLSSLATLKRLGSAHLLKQDEKTMFLQIAFTLDKFDMHFEPCTTEKNVNLFNAKHPFHLDASVDSNRIAAQIMITKKGEEDCTAEIDMLKTAEIGALKKVTIPQPLSTIKIQIRAKFITMLQGIVRQRIEELLPGLLEDVLRDPEYCTMLL